MNGVDSEESVKRNQKLVEEIMDLTSQGGSTAFLKAMMLVRKAFAEERAAALKGK